ncbi:MAG: hypothetical protein ABIN18_09250 [Pseudomonadota bacterium]
MVEIGELWAFEKDENRGFTEYLGYDPAARIQNQLVKVIKQGHDVQLHLHPQWLGAKWTKNGWQLDYSKYRLPDLDYHEMLDLFQRGRDYLETLLRPHCDDYSCIGFRAGNWITQPSSKYLRALYQAGLKSDTSVFKWGYVNKDWIYMDYRKANSNVLPWIVSWEDINRPGKDGEIIEFPIYSEPVNLFSLLTVKRLMVARHYLLEDRVIARSVNSSYSTPRKLKTTIWRKIYRLFHKYPKKFDFCKLTTREMLQMMENIRLCYSDSQMVDHVPIVTIGHSKELGSAQGLSRFLRDVSRKFGNSLEFVTYREVIRNADKTNN